MAYIYLLSLHEHINARINKAQDTLSQLMSDPNLQKRLEGRIDVLNDLKAYLANHINPKLPRAIKKQLKD